jgi:hypothetical protein
VLEARLVAVAAGGQSDKRLRSRRMSKFGEIVRALGADSGGCIRGREPRAKGQDDWRHVALLMRHQGGDVSSNCGAENLGR